MLIEETEVMSTAKLSHEVAAVLKEPRTEKNRFKSMELCRRIMDKHNKTQDILMQHTLRSWVGKVQGHFNG